MHAHRREDSRQGVGGAQGLGEPPVGQPYLMAGVEFGGNRGKADRQPLDAAVGERRFQLVRKMLAADEAGPRKTDVEVAEHAAHRQRTRPPLELVHLSRGVTPAHNGADRGAGDDVGHDAVGDQRLQYADMGEAACGASAERKADARARAGRFGRRRRRLGGTIAVARPREKAVKHHNWLLQAAAKVEPASPPGQEFTPMRHASLAESYDGNVTAGVSRGDDFILHSVNGAEGQTPSLGRGMAKTLSTTA